MFGGRDREYYRLTASSFRLWCVGVTLPSGRPCRYGLGHDWRWSDGWCVRRILTPPARPTFSPCTVRGKTLWIMLMDTRAVTQMAGRPHDARGRLRCGPASVGRSRQNRPLKNRSIGFLDPARRRRCSDRGHGAGRSAGCGSQRSPECRISARMTGIACRLQRRSRWALHGRRSRRRWQARQQTDWLRQDGRQPDWRRRDWRRRAGWRRRGWRQR